MGVLDIREDLGSIVTRLRSALNEYKDCEGCGTFFECVRILSNKYYQYFNCESRGHFNRVLVDIQAALELCEKNQRDFEIGSRSLYNVVFTVRSLSIEMEKLEKSLEILYNEVTEFWSAAKTIDVQNHKIVRILRDVWNLMKKLQESKYVMSIHQKDFIDNNLDSNLVAFVNYIECSKSSELNELLKSLGKKSMYFSETIRQMKYLSSLLLNHHKINDVHPLFSIYIIMLINHNIVEAQQNGIKESKAQTILRRTCCGPCRPKDNEEMLAATRYRQQTFSLVRCPDTTFNTLERMIVPIGIDVHHAAREVKNFHCASLRREEILLTAIQTKRMVLMRGLNELNNIMTTMEQMEEFNDTLVGKMTKTRPRFRTINEYLKLDLNNLNDLMNEDEDETGLIDDN